MNTAITAVATSPVARAKEICAAGLPDAIRRHPGPAFGCFPVYSPFELYHAAGLLPLGLMGAGGTIDIVHADARFQSFVCSIAKTTLELGLQKRLTALEGVAFHSICDVARNLASVFRRNFPGLHVEYIHLAQNGAGDAAEDYLVSEYRRALAGLEERLKRRIGDEAIRASIRTYNRPRALMRRLYEIRAREPERVTASEAFTLVRAGTFMPPEDHAALLEGSLAEFATRRNKRMDRVRVVVEGAFCEQPPVGLIDVMEAAGCYVVDDDFCAGWRWFREDVIETGDPVRALARAYLSRSRCSSTRHDPDRPRHLELVERVKSTGAQAVVFMPAKFCEPALFDYVLFRRELEKAGVPHILIEFEEKMWTFERTRGEIETFVESLLFD
ncbi:MAG: 2-hydroxyacyl-CoA dehydratase [Planctomycetes bacterium]|nr:2-hydroxyacyl-CoA dehydratase [Planctomycetota bacterium]